MMRILTLALAGAIALASAQAATAQTRVKPSAPTPPAPTLQKQAPKPDFVILHASAIGGSNNQFMVQLKNAGAIDSPGALLQAANMTPGNSGAATVPFPPIKAGQFVWVKVELNKRARPGNRILLFADHNNAVAETKENNNKYGFNW